MRGISRCKRVIAPKTRRRRRRCSADAITELRQVEQHGGVLKDKYNVSYNKRLLHYARREDRSASSPAHDVTTTCAVHFGKQATCARTHVCKAARRGVHGPLSFR